LGGKGVFGELDDDEDDGGGEEEVQEEMDDIESQP
jgi:hypothetical protein